MDREEAFAQHRQALAGVLIEFGHIELYSAMLARRVLTPNDPALGLEMLDALSTRRFFKLARRVIKRRTYYPAPVRDAIDELLRRHLPKLLDERNAAVHGVTIRNERTGEIRRVAAAEVATPGDDFVERMQSGPTVDELHDLARRAKKAGDDLFDLIESLANAEATVPSEWRHPSS